MLCVSHLAAFCFAFSTKTRYIQHQNTLHLAPKRTPFCTKTHSIQHQNATRLAAYCTTFSSKQPPNWCKWRPLFIKIHFACIYNYPFFASKQTSARIDYLRQGGRLVSRKGTQDVKFLAEKQTKRFCRIPTHRQRQGKHVRLFSDYTVSLSSTSHMNVVFIWFYSTKIINSSQFIEILKVKTTSIRNPLFVSLSLPNSSKKPHYPKLV